MISDDFYRNLLLGYPVDTESKLNVLCTFSLRSVSAVYLVTVWILFYHDLVAICPLGRLQEPLELQPFFGLLRTLHTNLESGNSFLFFSFTLSDQPLIIRLSVIVKSSITLIVLYSGIPFRFLRFDKILLLSSSVAIITLIGRFLSWAGGPILDALFYSFYRCTWGSWNEVSSLFLQLILYSWFPSWWHESQCMSHWEFDFSLWGILHWSRVTFCLDHHMVRFCYPYIVLWGRKLYSYSHHSSLCSFYFVKDFVKILKI